MIVAEEDKDSGTVNIEKEKRFNIAIENRIYFTDHLVVPKDSIELMVT